MFEYIWTFWPNPHVCVCVCVYGLYMHVYGFVQKVHKIKDKFFIFTNNFIDLDILNISAISHVL